MTTANRLPQFADVPTVSESGLPGFELNLWFALMAPAGTPKAMVNQRAAEIQKALQDTDVRDKLSTKGLTPRGTTSEELGTAMRAQLEKSGELIRKNAITSE